MERDGDHNEIEDSPEVDEIIPSETKQAEGTTDAEQAGESGSQHLDSSLDCSRQSTQRVEHLQLRVHNNNQQLQRINKKLEPYKCCVCAKYLRWGVITICGHFYCWGCLWPQLHDKAHPKCCRCSRPLILHEDIIPFHCDGPNDAAGYCLPAQPGNVPRPTGFYFDAYNVPNWFTFYERMEDAQQLSRNLFYVLGILRTNYPRTIQLLDLLQWIQVLCIGILCLLWCRVSFN
ncbi:E3 ubiquitin-protein ligase BRE1 [Drosophila obscura]|uniref:E3 ubiquitin-protein ligase BRE1 n=1 Tax=Drosophila obscura TaxID=7282 RepID=UPI001BB13CDF|nr:E3 ubiquitin-protein ligase BRE1 [Drosophila obscura]